MLSVQLFATPWTVACQTRLSVGFSRQGYWSGLHSLLQGIFLTQGSNQHHSCIGDSLPLNHLGSTVCNLSVQSLGCARLFETLWTAARQASLSFTNSRSLLKLMSIKSAMPSNHLILCHPLLPLCTIIMDIDEKCLLDYCNYFENKCSLISF